MTPHAGFKSDSSCRSMPTIGSLEGDRWSRAIQAAAIRSSCLATTPSNRLAMLMQGHGSPQKRFDASRHRYPLAIQAARSTFLGKANRHGRHFGVLVSMCLFLTVAMTGAGLSLSAAESIESTRDPQTAGRTQAFLSLYEASTKPFRLKWSAPENPELSTSGALTSAPQQSVSLRPISKAGDATRLSVLIDALKAHAGERLRLQYELIEVPSGDLVAREQTEITLDSAGRSEVISVADHSPEQVGVYEIRLRLLQPKDKIWERFSLRNSEIVAEVQTPWLVSHSAPATSDRSARDPFSVTASTAWKNIGQATQFDANLWMGTRWIPDATRFVPGAKRVGESLPIPHWRDEQPLKDHVLKSQQDVIAVLPIASPDDRCQLQFSIEQQSAIEDSTRLRIEIASSPQFDSIQQGDTYVIEPQFDAGAPVPLGNRHVAVAHRSTGKPQFVRIRNLSSTATVAIQSIDLLAAGKPSPAKTESGGFRHLTWSTRSWDWAADLVDRPTRVALSGRFAESTQLFEILWSGIRQLDSHARWLQYDRLMIQTAPEMDAAFHTELKQLAGASSTSDLRWCGPLWFQACDAWSQTIRTPIVMVDRRKGFQPEAAVVSIESTVFKGQERIVQSRLHAKLIERLLRDSPERIVIDSDRLPMAVDPQLLRTTEQVKRVPRSMRGIPSASPGKPMPGIQASNSQASNNQAQETAGPVGESVGVHVFVSEGLSDHSVVTLVNEAPWTNTVRLDLAAPSSLINPSDHSELQPDDRIVLPPSSVVNLVSKQSHIAVSGWKADFENPTQTIEHLKTNVSTVVDHIGTLGSPDLYDGIRNANFEANGKVGIVGWMHTQFPADAVQLDSDEASEGKNSIRLLTTEQNPGGVWIVSEPINVPATGRLSVSMSLRAAAKPAVNPIRQTAAEVMMNLNGGDVATASGETDQVEVAKSKLTPQPPSHDLRVSLEGIRGGEPVRFVSQFSLPCNGQWLTKKNILEIEGLNPDDLETIRLTIDSLTPGKLWIDDVRLHDNFATRAERSHLQGKVFLAIQGLQRGSYAPAAELLRNRWAQYLLVTHSSAAAAMTENKSAAASSIAPNKTSLNHSSNPTNDRPPAQGNRDSVAERIRDWLPRPIRF
ncbi:hypothetical protein [Roseiconus lacunae]|uniref:hypothetical protein n=1 Tax=Roseiconus lacunae TaxID=2605694 RepID=UPI001E4467E3|nr:hypothetical protein [Roseiconus lacunae]MCD0463450.1 hypothetical protein [Roseiconus lacunae]